MDEDKSIPNSIKKLRAKKGLGDVIPLKLPESLQKDIDSLSEKEIGELWSAYEESLNDE